MNSLLKIFCEVDDFYKEIFLYEILNELKTSEKTKQRNQIAKKEDQQINLQFIATTKNIKTQN